ncbi:uncharacterized protein rab11fip5a isoform X1 [Alosa sapidissima]|uniref:uncharacterized protein rab11fip5a isoform X1 n=3 Tax=Alosa sapidissima TaxID=34773 RepID=UPI001C07F584|nr:uncharacterized protein rab11fip5a isoform X1 [Alosa sapidissima]
MSSAITNDEYQRWVPTHVQVTVLRARGLRAKGKHGTNDAYVIIQVGKEKYSTCVMEKTMNPEWGEECTFELQPGVLEPGGRDVCPPGSCDLTLTAMHRALIGLDVFLGQAVIPLDKAFQDRISMKKEWHRLHSKTGKKEKERGEVQVSVQFTRHNMTASMYDLSMKDKPHSAFGKLKERIRGTKHLGDEDSASAIIPGGYGVLARMRGRLPSDGGGEEYYEDDEGGEARRSKMRNFFLRGRLRKSSDTRSSTSLGSESSESSSRGGSLSPTAGISVVVSDLSNSPSNSSNLTADNSPDHTVAPSPQVSPHKRIYDDEVCEISIPVPQSFTYDSLITEMVSSTPSSTAVANGHPVKHAPAPHTPKPKPQPAAPSKQGGEPAAPKALSLSPALGSRQKASAMSLSLQNLSVSHRAEEPHPGPGDGRRWSLDRAGEEERAAISAAIENAGKLEEEERRAAQFKKEATPAVTAADGEVKKQKWGLFSHGRSESTGKVATAGKGDTASAPSEGKHKGWFGSKDSHNKPSCLVSQGDPGSNTTPNQSPFSPLDLPQLAPPCHTNPFTAPPPLSNANPFLSLLQQNPFFQEIYVDAALTPKMSAFTYSSSPVPSNLLSGSSRLLESHVTEEAPPGDVNGMARLPQGVTDVANEGVHFNPFVSDMDGTQAWKSGDPSQTPEFPDPSIQTNPPNMEMDTNFTALTNTNTLNTQDLLQLSPNESQSSLPENLSMEFTRMHNLACPYPGLLLHQMDTPSRSETSLNETSHGQMPLGSVSNSQLAGSTTTWVRLAGQSVEMSGTAEGVASQSTELESAVSPLEIDVNGREADLGAVLSPSAGAEVTEMMLAPSKEPRVSAYREMSSDDTLEASTIVSYSPGRELDLPAGDPLPIGLESSHQEPREEQDKEKDKKETGDLEVKEPTVDAADVVVLTDSDTATKQGVDSRVVSECAGFGWESVEPSVGSSVQTSNRTGPESVSSGNHILDHSLEAESPFSGSLICIMASSPGEGLISSESRFADDSAVLSPTRVLQDMSPDDKHLPTSLRTGELETLHHKVLESPVSLLPSASLSSNDNANSTVNPFVSADSDAYVSPLVSMGPDDAHITSNPFFSLATDSVCASSHNSSISPNKDLLLAPQSTRFLGSLLYESAESECYHTCSSHQRHRSLCSQRSLPLITAKDPMQQLIAFYDLAVNTQPLQDPCQNTRQIHDPKVDDVSQFNLSPLSALASDLQMKSTVHRDVSSPLSLPTNGITQEAIPNQNSSLLIQRGNFVENFVAKEDPLPDVLWMSNLKDKAMSEQWSSPPPMLACDRTAESMPNYEFTEGVVPNFDVTQKDMPKSVLLQEVPATKDIEINPFVDGKVDIFPRDSVSRSPFTTESEVQDLSKFPVDWAELKWAAVGSTGVKKEVMSEAGASLLNETWASAPSWLTPVTSEDQNDRNTLPWVVFDQSLHGLSGGVSDGTLPSSSISQDLVVTHLHPQCPQTDTQASLKSSQEQLDLFGSTVDPFHGFPGITDPFNGDPFHSVASVFDSSQPKPYKMDSAKRAAKAMPTVKTAPKLSLRPELQLLSPLASSTPAADPFPLSFPAGPSALAIPSCPSPISSDLMSASQAAFPQEHQQASNQIASPHPVKPLTPPGEEKKSESRSVLEKLKSTINPGRSQSETDKKTLVVEGGGSYYHLNHSELVSLLLQREVDLQRERAEFERRGALLEKREAELRKNKLMIRDLEDYIDRLLVRIMAEKPTLLQVSRTKLK